MHVDSWFDMRMVALVCTDMKDLLKFNVLRWNGFESMRINGDFRKLEQDQGRSMTFEREVNGPRVRTIDVNQGAKERDWPMNCPTRRVVEPLGGGTRGTSMTPWTRRTRVDIASGSPHR